MGHGWRWPQYHVEVADSFLESIGDREAMAPTEMTDTSDFFAPFRQPCLTVGYFF